MREITLDNEGALATLTLRRPAQLNALNSAMLEALDALLLRIESSDAKVVLLTGEGNCFCAGGDINAWAGMEPSGFAYEWIRRGHRVFDRLAQLRQPTIAVLGGHALGGGLELAAACDFRVMEKHARLGLPETALGMVPGWSGSQRLVRRFGAQAVRRMALGGEQLNADVALGFGMVDRIAKTNEGLRVARALAREISLRGAAAIQTTKMMIAAAENEAPEAAVEAIAGLAIAATSDVKEGVAAFKQKRAPDFTGK